MPHVERLLNEIGVGDVDLFQLPHADGGRIEHFEERPIANPQGVRGVGCRQEAFHLLDREHGARQPVASPNLDHVLGGMQKQLPGGGQMIEEPFDGAKAESFRFDADRFRPHVLLVEVDVGAADPPQVGRQVG